jgi:hypothetical protein
LICPGGGREQDLLAVETEESVTLGRNRNRGESDSQRTFIPNNFTLGALGMEVKQYYAALKIGLFRLSCG